MMSLDELSRIVAEATRPDAKGFYRRHFGLREGEGPVEIKTWSEWSGLPLITKEELTAVASRERICGSWSDINRLGVTSGTTGKRPIVAMQSLMDPYAFRLAYHDHRKGCLAYIFPAPPHWHEIRMRERGVQGRVVVLDPKRPAASVRLAKAAGIDTLSVFTFHIPIVGPHIERAGFASRIRLIEICGEPCSEGLFSYISRTFPNAQVRGFYGIFENEEGNIAYTCGPITKDRLDAPYHAITPFQYHEILDLVTGSIVKPAKGAEGELVLTIRKRPVSVFPLIRYRTGDIIRVAAEDCAEHGGWSFHIIGRRELDFVKLPGGQLRVDELEKAVRAQKEYLFDTDFRAFVDESGEVPKPSLEIALHLRRPSDAPRVAKKIAAALRVGPAFTYADGVARGLYGEIVCENLAEATAQHKTKRIVSRLRTSG